MPTSTATTDPGPFLSRIECARVFGVSLDGLMRWVRDRTNPLPHYRFGRAYKFKPSEVEEWARKRARARMKSARV